MKKRFLSLIVVVAMVVASFSAFGAVAATEPSWKWSPAVDGYITVAGMANGTNAADGTYATFTNGQNQSEGYFYPGKTGQAMGDLAETPMGVIDAAVSKVALIKYRTQAEKQVYGEILWESGAGAEEFSYVNDGEWHYAVVDLGTSPVWTGEISWFRLDFANNIPAGTTSSVDVAYLAMFGTAAEARAYANAESPDTTPSIQMEKTEFSVGEQINITYNNIAKDNTWLCIYKGSGEGQTEATYGGRSGTDPSLQYIYMGGEDGPVTVPFNTTAPAGFTVGYAADDAFDQAPDMFWYRAKGTDEKPVLLEPGEYHAVVLGGTSWYVIKSNYIDFTVTEAPVLQMNKTQYTVGEQIDITYGNIAKDNTWLCIYKGSGEGQTEATYQGRSGSDPSLQYIYMGGEDGVVTVPFNTNAPAGFTVGYAADDTFDMAGNMFWYRAKGADENPVLLEPGEYHAVVLGGTSWYVIKTDYVDFTVVEAGPVDVTSTDQIAAPGDYKLAQDVQGNIEINQDGNYNIDLNGFVITGNITLLKGTVTINDSSADKTGGITNNDDDVIFLKSGSTADLTLNEIAIFGNASGCDGVCVQAGKVTINNCAIIALSSAVQNQKAEGTVIINGGYYMSDNNAFKVNNGAVIRVNSAYCIGALTTDAGRPIAEAFLCGENTYFVTGEIENPEDPTQKVTASIFCIFGDVNNDMEVNGADVVALLQALAEWDTPIDIIAADVNCDGIIDGKDATMLMQYVAEWEGIHLGPQEGTPSSWDDLDWTTPVK